MRELTTIEIRIMNTEKNIEKSLKTLERHKNLLAKRKDKLLEMGIDPAKEDLNDISVKRKYEDAYFEIYNYCDSLDSIVNTEKKISELHAKLVEYKAKKKEQDEKNNVPIVPAVEDFLNKWRNTADDYYRKRVTSLKKYKLECKAKRDEISKKYEPQDFLYRKEIEADEKEAGVDYKSMSDHIKFFYPNEVVLLASYRDNEFDERLNKLLNDEVRRKRVDLFIRCSKAVGVITDASGLYVGKNASLNGFVVGEQGKATVETIMAGGPVQCLHYRVLIKPVREVKKNKPSLADQINKAESEKVNVKKDSVVKEKER